MSEISKHFDLYQFFVYLLPGIFFMLVIYCLFLFNILDISFYESLENSPILPPYEGNSIIFSILGLIVAYFIGHILHMIGIFLFSYKNFLKRILKFFGCEKIKKEYKEKDSNEKSDDEKIKEYVEKQFGFDAEKLTKPDYMLIYLFLEDFVQSKKIKLMQVLLGLYKSLFTISLFMIVVFLINKYRIMLGIVIFLAIMFFKQANSYYKSGNKNGYHLAYLYFKNLKK